VVEKIIAKDSDSAPCSEAPDFITKCGITVPLPPSAYDLSPSLDEESEKVMEESEAIEEEKFSENTSNKDVIHDDSLHTNSGAAQENLEKDSKEAIFPSNENMGDDKDSTHNYFSYSNGSEAPQNSEEKIFPEYEDGNKEDDKDSM
jgi:hypothetical protein